MARITRLGLFQRIHAICARFALVREIELMRGCRVSHASRDLESDLGAAQGI